MLRLDGIEEQFLSVLQETANIDDINKNFARFSDNDWHKLYGLVIQTGLFPTFYARLRKLKLENIPPRFFTHLKNLYLLNLQRNLVLEQELFRIISRFKESNILVIPLKGPTLARYLYDDVASRRTSCDLDLLVRQEQFEQAEDMLEKIDYNPCDKNGSRCNFNLKYYRQLRFNKRAEGVENFLVELHADLRSLFVYTPLEDFWRDLQELDLDGNKILAPSRENLLIYISLLSMTITEFTELRYLYDIYTLITRFNDKMNWGALAKKIGNTRHKTGVFFTLMLSQEFFNFDIPQDFLNKIKPNPIKRAMLKIWINKRNVLNRRPDNSLSWYYFFTAWHYFITSLLYSKNIFDCIRIVYRKIFLPRDEMRGLYNQTWTSFLYVKRLLKPVSRLLKNFT